MSGKKKGKKGAKADEDMVDLVSESKDFDDELSQTSSNNVGKKGKKSGKSKKSDFDDDFALENESEAAEELPEASSQNAKKGKKAGKSKNSDFDDDFNTSVDSEKPAPLEEAPAPNSQAGKKKGKKGKKGKSFDDDFNDPDPILAPVDEIDDHVAPKKGSSKISAPKAWDLLLKDEEAPESVEEVSEVVEDAEEEPVVFTGKKKPKKKALVVPEEEPLPEPVAEPEVAAEEEEEPIVFTGKKKKPKKKTSTFVLPEDDDEVPPEVVEDEKVEEVSSVTISAGDAEFDAIASDSKKKGKKSKKGKQTSRTVAEEEEIDAILAELDGPQPAAAIAAAAPDPEPADESEGEDIVFTGKKKPKKKTSSFVLPDDDEETVAETEEDLKQEEVEDATTSAVKVEAGGSVAASEKKKGKKGKKGKQQQSVQSVQEQDELDAILAELDGPARPAPAAAPAPEVAAAVAVEVAVVAEGGEEEAATGAASESAAAKKRKKKKEKEKKDASLEVKEEAEGGGEKGKGVKDGKKLPKHVREMQERLAKIKEMEEKAQREEEEKRRKEEEEAARLAELERLKEEAKKRRKEREKEKIAQLKKEGKFLTAKGREEKKKLAAFREQLLAQQQALTKKETDEEEKAKKKVVYNTKKKSRGAAMAGGGEVDAAEPPLHSLPPEAKVEEAVQAAIAPVAAVEEEKPAVVEEEEEEDDWDAKSWDEEVVLTGLKKPVAAAEAKEAEEASKKEPEPAAAPKEAKPAAVVEAGQNPEVEAEAEEESETESETESGSEEESDSGSEESDSEDEFEKRRQVAQKKREERKAEAMKKRSADDLRSPICCILGHVDTGKTKLLDCVRRTNVQEGEAGGITQQIGATYVPAENIRDRTKELKAEAALKVPGLLIIDTPGHESFTNLRSRGSGLCDIAVLVIDVMHGLEPQTIESLNLLKMRKTPFIVALNKVDRMYGWNAVKNAPIRNSMKEQRKDTIMEFDRRTEFVITQLMEQGLNSALYWKNPDLRKYISVVPTSAITGEGIPDLLMVLVQLTQKMMQDQLMYISEVQCTVLEVKVIEGLGTTIDVVLVNGVLHEGDQVVIPGMQGPIVTTIRALLTPHPMKELRVKGSYLHHKELKAAQGIKITAQGLEHAIAGTQLYVVGPDDDLEDMKREAMQDVEGVLSRIDRSGEGVCVQASTLGSLEALLEFLKSPDVKIPVSGISIGPVHKKDVMRASVMLERKKKEYAVILAFDVKVSTEAQEVARELGVTIFTADIIYHLFDQFTAYMKDVKEKAREATAEEAVFPVILKIMPNCIFNKKDPIVLGVEVLEGVARIGTPICIPSQGFIDIGKIASIEKDHKVVDTAKKGQAVAMKIVGSSAEELQKSYGRHFTEEDELVSHISRRSIDVLKEHFRNDLSKDEWILVVKLKKLFDIA